MPCSTPASSTATATCSSWTAENGWGAAAHLDVLEHHARIDLLVVDPTLNDDNETRLVDVVRALGKAYGCEHVELEVRP